MGLIVKSKIINFLLIFSGIFFYAASASADTANIPKTFIAGETAVAKEVNDNFTALKDAIDGNASKLPVLKDADGVIKGTIITYLSLNITLMSEKSFIFMIDSSTGEFNNNYLFYESIDCAGIAYTSNIQAVQTDGTDYLYVPKGSSPVLISAKSSSSGGGCSNSDFSVKVYPTLVNDPAITGVESAPLTLPLTIETL